MRISSSLFALMFLAVTSSAQPVYWQSSNSPAAAAIVGFVKQSSGTWFAAAKDGTVLKSTNDGKSWTIASKELTNASCIGMDALNQATAYVGTSNGVWMSASGANFKRTTASPSNSRIQSLYVLSNNLIECGTSTGVYLSSDRGSSWELFNDGLLNTNVQAGGAAGTGYIYAGTSTGLFVGSNGGSSWMTTDNLGSVNVKSFRAYGNTGSVYVGSTNGVYRSNNWGVNWSKVLTASVTVQSIIRSSDAMLAGSSKGLYYSTNQGSNWQLASGGMQDSNVTAVMVTSDNHGLVGTNGGDIYRSNKTLTALLDVKTSETSSPLVLYPNPVNSVLHLAYGEPDDIEVTMLDWLGREVLRRDVRANERIDLDVRFLPSGTYTVLVDAQKGRIIRHLSIER